MFLANGCFTRNYRGGGGLGLIILDVFGDCRMGMLLSWIFRGVLFFRFGVAMFVCGFFIVHLLSNLFEFRSCSGLGWVCVVSFCWICCECVFLCLRVLLFLVVVIYFVIARYSCGLMFGLGLFVWLLVIV